MRHIVGFGDDLYWAENKRILRIRSGGIREVLYTIEDNSPESIYELAVRGNSIYFILDTYEATSIGRLTIGGSAPEKLASLADNSFTTSNLQLANDYFCVIRRIDLKGHLRCAPLSGGEFVDSGFDVFAYTTLANDLIFFGVQGISIQELLRGTLPLPFATTPRKLPRPSGLNDRIGMSIVGNFVYYRAFSGLSRVPFTAEGPPESLVSVLPGNQLALIGDEFFYSENGTVVSMKVDSGARTLLGESSLSGGGLVARTTTRVYMTWNNFLVEFKR